MALEAAPAGAVAQPQHHAAFHHPKLEERLALAIAVGGGLLVPGREQTAFCLLGKRPLDLKFHRATRVVPAEVPLHLAALGGDAPTLGGELTRALWPLEGVLLVDDEQESFQQYDETQ